MARILLIITALTTAIAFAVGCGKEGASSSDAASLAPAGSLVYGEATLKPEGDQKAAIDSIVSKFPGEGTAGERISQALEKAIAESDPEFSWKRDFEPWIGDEAAFFVSGVSPATPGSPDAKAALLVATDDEDATVETLEKEKDGRKTDYRGRDLFVFGEDETAAAVVDGWLVLGNAGGVKAAIDVAEGDDPIDGEQAYEDALADAPDERLGFVYVNTPLFAKQLEKAPTLPGLAPFRRLFEEPIVATMDADEAGVRVEATVPESLLTGFPVVGEGSDVADGLPADSWLAIAQPDLGKLVETYADTVGASIGGRDVLEQQIRSATGLEFDELVSWMGDWGVFVRGTSVPELNGAMIIESSDEDASGRFLDAIERLARKNAEPGTRIGPLAISGGGEGFTWRGPSIDQPIHIFQRDGKVVTAYGDSAARDALDPAEKLGDTATFADAKEALGGDYALSFFLAVDPILRLADSAGAASDPDWQEAKPYLEPFGALVGGAQKEGDKVRSAFGVSVK
jgi:Protein of unknown function (DUF3352)